MAKHAFKITMLVYVDTAERDEEDENGDPLPEPTLDEIREYLEEALTLDVDTEEYQNPVGFQSAEIDFDSMAEMTAAERKRLYGK